MFKSILPLTALSGLAAAGAALAQLPATSDASKVVPGAYKVEPSHTQAMFSVDRLGFSKFAGGFTRSSGTLRIDPKNLGAAVLDIDVAAASVQTPVPQLDEILRGDQWLDAKKFPTLHLHATRVTRTGPNTADVSGELTIHGVTRSVVLKAHLDGSGVDPLFKQTVVGFDAHGRIKRSDYGVKTFLPLVGDDVDLTINAFFTKES